MLELSRAKIVALAILGVAAALTRDASAVVLHPSTDPATLGQDDQVPAGSRPVDAVIGRWGSDASAVAIGPDAIITTRHQSGGFSATPGAGTTVVFNGIVYSIAQPETDIGNTDARVVKLTIDGTHPALTNYVPIYTGNDLSQPIVLGGYGVVRGADRTATGGGTYGYDWGTNTNTNLRWGANVTDAAINPNETGGTPYTSDVLTADFDRAGSATAVAHEGIISDHDSGGGWFILDAGVWKLAGLNAYVGHSGFTFDPLGLNNTSEPERSSLFASHANAAVDLPDGMEAIRLSPLASQINAAIPEPGTVGLVIAGMALAMRRRRD